MTPRNPKKSPAVSRPARGAEIIISLIALTSLFSSGCTVGEYTPPPAGARSAPPAKAPAPGSPRPFAFTEPVRSVPAGAAPNGEASSLPIGKACRVHFKKGDANDASKPAPVGMSPVEGAIEQVTPEWLVLRSGGNVYWISRANVLMVEFPASN